MDEHEIRSEHAENPSPGGARLFRSVLKEYLWPLIAGVILAGFIMTFIAQSYIVEGSSMEPTLHHGERLLIDKVTYRFKEPSRGDIVVLSTPRAAFVKRVIAVGGDHLEIKDGVVYLNGRPMQESYIAEPTEGEWGPYDVPDGTVFVMGDNRNFSNDSRRGVGFLDVNKIRGRAFIRYYPLHKITLLRRPQIEGQ
ncbi:MAG: signal peptidase I [Firmicutes bacterium]|jgi:signal peptidase I|nr:signal peptidase I [Bacillota bacterium]